MAFKCISPPPLCEVCTHDVHSLQLHKKQTRLHEAGGGPDFWSLPETDEKDEAGAVVLEGRWNALGKKVRKIDEAVYKEMEPHCLQDSGVNPASQTSLGASNRCATSRISLLCCMGPLFALNMQLKSPPSSGLKVSQVRQCFYPDL